MKKSIFKRIGLIALAVCVAIGSFFVPVTRKQYNSASASVALPGVNPVPSPDTDFTHIAGSQFVGSDIFLVNFSFMSSNTLITDFSNYVNNGVYDINNNYFRYQFGLSLFSDSFMLSYKAVRSLSQNAFIKSSSSAEDSINSFQNVFISGFGINNLVDSFVPNSYINVESVTAMQVVSRNGSALGYVNFGVQIFKNNSGVSQFVSPTLDMSYLLLMNYTEVESLLGIPYNDKFDSSNVICYVDSAGYYYLIYIPSDNFYSEVASPYFFNYRRYILKELDFSDSQLYQQGYNEGLADNQQSIYNNGYNAGYDVGFGQGRQDGIVEANDYSFISLIGSVIDVPVQTFMGLLNFTFLGVNLFDFICAILTFLLIIFVVKLFIGGK